MKEKLNEIGEVLKKRIPDYVTFIISDVVVGIAFSLADIGAEYLFPVGYLGGLLHPKLTRLVSNKINLK